jgi:predicted amidohydrolase YtcJ
MFGVTAVTDATPTNGPDEATWLRTGLMQEVLVMGDDRLDGGPRKVMLHEDHLPPFEQLLDTIAAVHERRRAVAVHCVTRSALWYALAAFAEAGTAGGDRIEHGSVIPPDAVPELARLGLTVVTQPNFVAERGDQYLEDVDPDDQPWLYRIASLIDNGIDVAGGTDAPFGDPDPWRAMRAAVDRRTANGQMLGADERVSPETALSLFLGSSPVVAPGARADLCLLTVSWSDARHDLSSDLVAATIRRGQLMYRRTP